ncbi:LysR family transcriptional regulator [Massilistercora timonensis]|uniref:LysR family transcriptional regulator n=1 Tax=Massilistercora timonensis TaxID=2086584 RepID=UPI00320A50F7
MEIRVLRYFLAVARKGSITAAANYLHLTQPTLSRQLKDLEEELGQTLLIRKSHRVTLTPEGMLLRKRAEEIIAMVDKTQSEFVSLGNTVSGNVYIGGGETRVMKEIATVIRDIQTAFPAIHFHLYSGNAEDVTERLDKGLLDFGVLIQPADLSRYQSLQLKGKDQWGVLMPKDSPLAAKKAIKKEDLLDLPLICSRQAIRRHINGNAFSHWFGEDFERLNIVSTFNLIYNAALLVEAGAGYAISLDGLTDTSRDSALCFRPLSPRLESRLAIVWKKDQVFSPAAQLFLDRITDLYQSGSTDS